MSRSQDQDTRTWSKERMQPSMVRELVVMFHPELSGLQMGERLRAGTRDWYRRLIYTSAVKKRKLRSIEHTGHSIM